MLWYIICYNTYSLCIVANILMRIDILSCLHLKQDGNMNVPKMLMSFPLIPVIAGKSQHIEIIVGNRLEDTE